MEVYVNTPIRASDYIKFKIKTNLNKSTYWYSDVVYFYLTSLKNSPGFTYETFKDGKPMEIVLNKNTYASYNIQPEKYNFLESTGKCQQKAFYECIALQLDLMELRECPKKCMPIIFSNVGMMNFRCPSPKYENGF